MTNWRTGQSVIGYIPLFSGMPSSLPRPVQRRPVARLRPTALVLVAHRLDKRIGAEASRVGKTRPPTRSRYQLSLLNRQERLFR